ncbi:MAG: hypothetical protein M3O70_12575 [Actinomycetota bacterium]|nr:hypothetical protein [Actinomycetota bacterium]
MEEEHLPDGQPALHDPLSRYGDDRLFGQGGDDHLTGGGGLDLHEGGPGDDLCAGGAHDSYNDCERGFPATLVSATHDGAGGTAARPVLASVFVLWLATSGLVARVRRGRPSMGP